MARLAAPVLALALGAALAFGLVSCGGRDRSGLLAGTTAQQILANLDQVRADAAAGDCSAAAAEVATVEDQIAALPTSVDARLRSRLGEGARRLAVIVDSPGACTTASTAATQSSTTPSTTPHKPKPKQPKTTTTSTTTNTTFPTTTASTTSTAPPPTNTTGGTGTPGGVAPPGQRQGGR